MKKLFTLISINESNSGTSAVLILFNKDEIIDQFAGGDNLTSIVNTINGLKDFSADVNSSTGCFSFIQLALNFQIIKDQFVSKNVGPSPGSSSYERGCQGYCYGWEKGASTPGVLNNTQNNGSIGSCALTSSLTPTWNISNLKYKSGSTYTSISPSGGNTFQVTALTGPNILNSTKDTATLYLDLTNVTIPTGNGNNPYEINVNIYRDINPADQTVTDVELYDVISVDLTIAQKYSNIVLKFPASKDYVTYIQVSTAPGTCPFFTPFQKVQFDPSALPVLLKNISVKNKDNSNNLTWITSTEQNNKGFEIQRSIGNTNDFKTIGFVGTRAKDGNSQTEIAYSFEDADVKAGQTHYYRLNQIDFDGKATLSPVRSVKPGSIESNLNVYPNPSQGSVTVNTGSASGKLNIYVLDNSGRVVNQYINVSTSNTRINNLKKGFYTLKLVNTETGEQSAQRVVVQ